MSFILKYIQTRIELKRRLILVPRALRTRSLQDRISVRIERNSHRLLIPILHDVFKKGMLTKNVVDLTSFCRRCEFETQILSVQ